MNVYVAEARPVAGRTDYRGSSPVTDDIHPLRARGPKYPPHNSDAPILEGIDVVGLAGAIVITLGPLAAYAVGMGA
jgi:hypothetical protein